MTKSPLARIAIAVSIAALVLALVPTALAGKGGKPGGGSGGSTTGSGSFSLVLLNSSDGLPHWGQLVTFNVSTSASRPFVSLQCFQGGMLVYSASVGYYDDYPWRKDFTLSSYAWSGGAADCTAQLYSYSSTGKKSVMGTMGIHVYA